MTKLVGGLMALIALAFFSLGLAVGNVSHVLGDASYDECSTSQKVVHPPQVER